LSRFLVKSFMKIAIAQLNPMVGNLKGNAAQILVAAEQAVQSGTRLLLTPELSMCGYPPRDLLLNPEFIAVMEQTLQQLAQQLPPQLAVLVGVSDTNPTAGTTGTKPLFNSTVWLEAGNIQARFRKQLLPTYDVFDEDRYFASESSDNIMVLDEVRIGISICEDLWNEESFWGKRSYGINPIAQLASQSVDLIVNVSASPFCVGKQALRESMLSHTAHQYDCPILYVNQVGGNDDLIFDGRSVVMNQQGMIFSRGKPFAPDLLSVDYDADQRQMKPGNVAASPEDVPAEIWGALLLGVRDYARKCGFQQAVIGLSGGIDSALVAAIAAEALGADRVLGVLMPSPYSSDHSVTDALALADNLGIQTQTLPIGPLMGGFEQTLTPLFAGTESGIAEENIQARIRGNLLMAIANKFNRLLISTGNKSEMAVGYCTLYGDMSGGLAAIADLPKTRVYELCHWLNQPDSAQWVQTLKGQPIIPPSILTKLPSAELKPGQVDQDSLPPYDILDDILSRSIDRHQSSAEIIAAGHDAVIVARTLQMLSRAEFKRRQAAPGLKITDRAFGTGWRMPIAARHCPAKP
jgi:NAD+ synthase (glutamine-hydrolysing)